MSEQFSGLPMDSLIGAPLNAAVQANSAMALTQTKFLLDTCFKQDGEGDNVGYDPIMISMTLTRSVIKEDGTSNPFITKFEIPLLTIIPLNSLGVDDVTVAFEMEVKSSFDQSESESSSSAKNTSGSFGAKLGWGCFSASVKGSISHDQKSSSSKDTHYQKSNSAKYTVNVHAGQIPLPEGVSTIISAYSKAIEPIQIENKGS